MIKRITYIIVRLLAISSIVLLLSFLGAFLSLTTKIIIVSFIVFVLFLITYLLKSKKLQKTIRKTQNILSSVIVIVFVLIYFFIVVSSNETTEQFIDENCNIIPNSIATIEKIELGNLDQYIIIRGRNINNPVLLYLHGGPGGGAEFTLVKDFYPELEEHFVVIYWEQRGSGKSYSSNISKETMNIEQFVSDANELSEYLIQKFKKQKIYIMGGSWGAILGLLSVKERPDLFHAFIGFGLPVNIVENIPINRDSLISLATKTNNQKAIKELSAIKTPRDFESSMYYQGILDKYDKRVYKGYVSNNFVSLILKRVMLSNEYTFLEKYHFVNFHGVQFVRNSLWDELLKCDLRKEANEINIPVYLFHGYYDFGCPLILVNEYFKLLKAPEKKLYIFENSGHDLIFDNPDRFDKILMDSIISAPN